MIGIHTGGFELSRDEATSAARWSGSAIEYPVVIDAQLELWDFYGNEGWPARYLWDTRGLLFSLHYGEGAYEESEREIQELLGVDAEPLAPLRPEDAPGVLLPAQTEDQPGAYCGPYEAGGVWGVFDGVGEVVVNGRALTIAEPGRFPLVEHAAPHRRGARARGRRGVTCLATCFTPGVAARACRRVPSSLISSGGRAVLDQHRGARPVRRPVRLRLRKCAW